MQFDIIVEFSDPFFILQVLFIETEEPQQCISKEFAVGPYTLMDLVFILKEIDTLPVSFTIFEPAILMPVFLLFESEPVGWRNEAGHL